MPVSVADETSAADHYANANRGRINRRRIIATVIRRWRRISITIIRSIVRIIRVAVIRITPAGITQAESPAPIETAVIAGVAVPVSSVTVPIPTVTVPIPTVTIPVPTVTIPVPAAIAAADIPATVATAGITAAVSAAGITTAAVSATHRTARGISTAAVSATHRTARGISAATTAKMSTPAATTVSATATALCEAQCSENHEENYENVFAHKQVLRSQNTSAGGLRWQS
jgi:hypothetical protein